MGRCRVRLTTHVRVEVAHVNLLGDAQRLLGDERPRGLPLLVDGGGVHVLAQLALAARLARRAARHGVADLENGLVALARGRLAHVVLRRGVLRRGREGARAAVREGRDERGARGRRRGRETPAGESRSWAMAAQDARARRPRETPARYAGDVRARRPRVRSRRAHGTRGTRRGTVAHRARRRRAHEAAAHASPGRQRAPAARSREPRACARPTCSRAPARSSPRPRPPPSPAPYSADVRLSRPESRCLRTARLGRSRGGCRAADSAPPAQKVKPAAKRTIVESGTRVSRTGSSFWRASRRAGGRAGAGE